MPKITERGKKNERRGKGQGASYKPYIKISEFNSNGTTANVIDWKHGRVIEALSVGEELFYYLIRWDDNVEDIREQYPLDTNVTKRIAKEHGIKHPSRPFTTDFLVTYNNGSQRAYSVKSSRKDLDPGEDATDAAKKKAENVCYNLMIEKLYWIAQKVPFSLVFKEDINITYADNIRRVVEYYKADSVHDDISHIKHLIASKRIKIDMELPIDYLDMVKKYKGTEIWKLK